MAGEFNDRQRAVIEPLLPQNQPGTRRVDDRRDPSRDCPCATLRRGLWQRILAALARAEPDGVHLIDSTTVKAHRAAADAKRGPPLGQCGGAVRRAAIAHGLAAPDDVLLLDQ